MNWWIVAGSLALALAIGVAVFLWPRRGVRIESAEEVAIAADAGLPGFVTAGAVVGVDGAAGLAVDGRGRVAVCKRFRKRLAVREVGWDTVRAAPGGMVIDTGDRRFGRVTVAGVDALDVRRLAPHLTRV